jgi:hypothetical protein
MSYRGRPVVFLTRSCTREGVMIVVLRQRLPSKKGHKDTCGPFRAPMVSQLIPSANPSE